MSRTYVLDFAIPARDTGFGFTVPSMTPLQIEVGGRSFTFDGSAPVTIGRDAQNDVTLTAGTVSRRHAEIRPDTHGWTLVDIGSASGTFFNGTRITELRLSGSGTVLVGGTEGEPLTYSVAGARPAASADVVLPPPGLAQTVLPGGAVPGSFTPGPALLVRAGGSSKRFVPGTTVRIGRDPANEIVVDDSSVSRLHAVVESRPDGWWYVDRSTAGTFDGEDRVRTRKLAGPATLMLGHPTAGVEVEVVPVIEARQAQKAIAGKKRKRTALLVGGIAAAVLLVGGGVTAAALFAGGGDGDDDEPAGEGLTAEELKRAKLATVQVRIHDQAGQFVGHGSGAIISSDGLVVTNAHVADPNAPGQGSTEPDPGLLTIALPTEDDDAPAVETYQAELLVSDGVLDVAVLQISADLEGNPIAGEDLELPEPMPIGDSDELETDEEIRVLGFPALATIGVESDDEIPPLTVTRGVVSTFLSESGIDDPRAWYDTDARIAGGNSGGPSINEDGEMIGLNTQAFGENLMGDAGPISQGSGRARPVNLLEDVIAIAEQGGDPSYVSPYFTGDPDDPAPPPPAGAAITSAGWSLDGQSDCTTASTPEAPQILSVALPTTLYAHFAANGVPDGTALQVVFTTLDGTPLAETSGIWDLGDGQVCATATIDLPAEAIPGVVATMVIGDAQVANPLQFQ